MDFDRAYLLQDLLLSGFVERYGYVEGVGAAPASAPRTNLTGDPYYTDGYTRIFLSNQSIPLGTVERLPWNVPLSPREDARRTISNQTRLLANEMKRVVVNR